MDVLSSLATADVDAVGSLVSRARSVDGVAPVSEQGLIRLREGRGGVRHLLLRREDAVLGYAQLDLADAGGPVAELLVDPDARRRGHGTALLAAVRAAADDAGGKVRVWAHGGLPAARRLAAKADLTAVRELRQMRRALTPEDAAHDTPLPEGVTVRAFVPGRDEDAWLRVNAAAFAHHPEQGALTRDDLAARQREQWFDPSGFFLAERGAGTPDARLVGFHWTKTHPDLGLGEVYVVGVAPGEQGAGLGRALTDIGVRHLAENGWPGVLLYVDADNAAAVRVYERLGFTVHEVDLMYLG